MPDDVYVIKADTRRELKSVIKSEADMCGEDAVGLSKKRVAEFAAMCWRDRKNPKWNMDYALGWHNRGQISQYCYGIFVSRATRSDYLNHENENN